jgi:hypothetical protein
MLRPFARWSVLMSVGLGLVGSIFLARAPHTHACHGHVLASRPRRRRPQHLFISISRPCSQGRCMCLKLSNPITRFQLAQCQRSDNFLALRYRLLIPQRSSLQHTSSMICRESPYFGYGCRSHSGCSQG